VSDDRHQLIRDAFASWNAGEREFNPERTHPDFVLHSVLTSDDFHGPEGFSRWTAEIDEQFEHWSVSFDTLEDAPDGRVLALGEIRFVGRSSGIESRQEAGWVFRFEGDRAIEMWNFADREAARREAGVEQ
jgi:ketosteroid isomerase-like protein